MGEDKTKADVMRERAQRLRREMTKEERKLWYECLSKMPMRFLRQYVVGTYILDFYCRSLKLAIEIDGRQHETPEGLARDARRTAFLNGEGIVVLRIPNTSIHRDFRGVCERIWYEIERR